MEALEHCKESIKIRIKNDRVDCEMYPHAIAMSFYPSLVSRLQSKLFAPLKLRVGCAGIIEGGSECPIIFNYLGTNERKGRNKGNKAGS